MFLYVIAEPSATIAKVGRTATLAARLDTMRGNSPVHLDLRAAWEAGDDTEPFVHQALLDRRVHHEWFEFGSEDPVAVVTALLRREPLADPLGADSTVRKPRALGRRQIRTYGRKPKNHPGYRQPGEGWNVRFVDEGVAREYRLTRHGRQWQEEYGDWLEPVEYVARQGPDTVFQFFVPAGKYPDARAL